MRQGDARTRRAYDFKFRRRRLAACYRFDCVGDSQWMSSNNLMHALGHQRIAHGIDCIVESNKLRTNRFLFGFRHWLQPVEKKLLLLWSLGRILLRLLPKPVELNSINDVVGGNGFNRQVFAWPGGLLQLFRHQRRKLAEAGYELRLAGFLQPAFESVAKQRAERLPLTYAVKQPARQSHPFRRQIDRQQIVGVLTAGVGQMSTAQYSD